VQLVPVGFTVVEDALVLEELAGLVVDVVLVDVDVGLTVEVLLMVDVGWVPPVAVQVPIGPGAVYVRLLNPLYKSGI